MHRGGGDIWNCYGFKMLAKVRQSGFGFDQFPMFVPPRQEASYKEEYQSGTEYGADRPSIRFAGIGYIESDKGERRAAHKRQPVLPNAVGVEVEFHAVNGPTLYGGASTTFCDTDSSG